MAEINFKELQEAVKALNGTDLLEKNIKVVGLAKDKMLSAFVEAVDGLDEDDAKGLPKKVKKFYNSLPDDIFDDEDGEEEDVDVDEDEEEIDEDEEEEEEEETEADEDKDEDADEEDEADEDEDEEAEDEEEEEEEEEEPEPPKKKAKAKKGKGKKAPAAKKGKGKKKAAEPEPEEDEEEDDEPEPPKKKGKKGKGKKKGAAKGKKKGAAKPKKEPVGKSAFGHRGNSMSGIIDDCLAAKGGATKEAIAKAISKAYPEKDESAVNNKITAHMNHLKSDLGVSIKVNKKKGTYRAVKEA